MYLLDSHVLIWSLYDNRRLPSRYRPMLRGDGVTWISAATVWEIEIKKRAGKLPIPEEIWNQAAEVGHRFLIITPAHAVEAASLPTHHTDPFDRMLIAQTRLDGLRLMSTDRQLRAYDVAFA
ncbi:PIN domain nuclease of toxin-antitoxin system [Hoeflea marina]|uniref:PIN domain nuclease of toxin-antitoxin system n=1 Tax=Hoeflea marina TaxID=274592 RepID=A0A317PXE5_9HYPH|nr:type II toxin-antitoxin system VapC family toxin [Hoeflea marina]PWW04170.1 PIN domain nuclease of toxin-antitoxin system [Hoeflea marina]